MINRKAKTSKNCSENNIYSNSSDETWIQKVLEQQQT